jgi:pimeloyl-ACP methyl ester carboxylesterase
MLLAQPHRFGKVLALDPVTPYGIAFGSEQIAVFRAMMENQTVARAVMATAATSLFVPASLLPGAVPQYRDNLAETHGFFERLLEETSSVSEGIWLGTPHNLNLEKQRQELAPRMAEIAHEHLVLWGEADGWISTADLRDMAKAMPHCRVVTIPDVGHSMNIEQPALYAGYFGGFFGGMGQ